MAERITGFGYVDYKDRHVTVNFYLDENGQYYCCYNGFRSKPFASIKDTASIWGAVEEIESKRRELDW